MTYGKLAVLAGGTHLGVVRRSIGAAMCMTMAAMFLMAAPMTAWAQTWSGGAPTITGDASITISGSPSGTLNVPNGATVTITGNAGGNANTNSITLDIGSGATVNWRANLRAGMGIAAESGLITIIGSGTFNVEPTDSISTNTSTPIIHNGTGVVNILSGRIVTGSNNPPAIRVRAGGTINVLGGVVRAATNNVQGAVINEEPTPSNGPCGEINVLGGEVRATNTVAGAQTSAITVVCGRVTVSGGLVTSNSTESTGTINVNQQATRAGRLDVLGGTITNTGSGGTIINKTANAIVNIAPPRITVGGSPTSINRPFNGQTVTLTASSPVTNGSVSVTGWNVGGSSQSGTATTQIVGPDVQNIVYNVEGTTTFATFSGWHSSPPPPLQDFRVNITPQVISTPAITVTAPATNVAPNATATPTGTVNFTAGTVTWAPTHNPFEANQAYTATVTLTRTSANYTFEGLSTATINGQTVTPTNNTGNAVTLSRAFPATTGLTITSSNFSVTNNTPTFNNTPQAATVDFSGGITTTQAGTITRSYEGRDGTTYPKSETAPTNAGSYNVLVTTTGGTIYAAATDLNVGLLTIAPLPVTITPDANQSKVYNQPDPVFTFTPATPPHGGSFVGALSRASGENVNTYDFTLGSLSAGSNYTLSLGGSNQFAITPQPITSAAITVTAPTIGSVPNATANGTGNFTPSAVTWSPTPPSTFQANQAYTATVTLTAGANYAFASTLSPVTINEQTATVINNAGGAGGTATLTYEFPARWSVTVSSAGTGASGSGNYLQGETVTINAGTAPSNQRFVNWTVTSGSGVTFASANSASTTFPMPANAVTVTANFVNTYTVSYNGNGNTGGTVPVDNTIYDHDATVTVLGNTGNLVRTNHTFEGWNTAANGSGTTYAPSATFPITANTTLYAKWEILPTLSGTPNISGTSGIGQQLTFNNGSLNVTTGLSYQWRANDVNITGATNSTYTLTALEAGKAITCVVTSTNALGYVTATFDGGAVVPYDIAITLVGNETGDAATRTPIRARAGETVTVNFTVANTEANNTLTFSGVTPQLEAVTLASTGTRSYTVNSSDNVNGVITITATFLHTALTPQTLSFAEDNRSAIYGSGTFPKTAASNQSGAQGAITYTSSDPTVATVNPTTGVVTITGVGQTTITATIAACGSYAQATASYVLNVELGVPTITDLTPNDGQVTVIFTPVLGAVNYRVEVVGDPTKFIEGTGTSLTVLGLTNGTSYTFTVTAYNTAGRTSTSDPSNPVTPFFSSPATGLPNLTAATMWLYILIAASLSLWGYVGYTYIPRRKSKRG